MQRNYVLLLAALGGMTVLAGCNRAPETPASTAEQAAAVAADTAKAAAQAAQEAELKSREAELAAREAALAEAQAAQAAANAAKVSPPAAASKPARKPAVAAKPAPVQKPVATAALPPPAPRILVVPGGTQLSLALASDVSSKTAKVGDAIRARVLSDITVDGQVAIAAGTIVAGQVTDVVSGSDKIGGVPTLGLRFDHLEFSGGKDIPISGELTQKGKNDSARDTAKIVGGAAAGAILGHQVKSNTKGKVIGGLLGGAIGAIAAHETGTEVQLAAGTQLSIALASAVEITAQ
jgi:anti-sigma factor RsiW